MVKKKNKKKIKKNNPIQLTLQYLLTPLCLYNYFCISFSVVLGILIYLTRPNQKIMSPQTVLELSPFKPYTTAVTELVLLF